MAYVSILVPAFYTKEVDESEIVKIETHFNKLEEIM